MTGPILKLKSLYFPKIECLILSRKNIEYSFSFRIQVAIKDNKNLQIIFGIQAFTEKNKNTELLDGRVTVEALATFELNEDVKKDIHTLKDISHLPNMLAIIFPYLREKIHYCFMSNELPLTVDPINTYEVVKFLDQSKHNNKIIDERVSKNIELKS